LAGLNALQGESLQGESLSFDPEVSGPKGRTEGQDEPCPMDDK